MKPSTIGVAASAALATAQTTGKMGNAAITENNPTMVAYMASLPSGTSVQGTIEGVSNANGTGVEWNINFFQFPDAFKGPFLYSIHDGQVPSSGSCSSTLGVLDPYDRGSSPTCNAFQPETCEVGDLSGKHGNISSTVTSFQVAYLDLYTSTEPGLNSFFGNRSIVIQSSDLTILACANFALAPGSPTPTPVSGVPSATSSGSASTASAAASSAASSAAASGSSTASASTASSSSSSSSTSRAAAGLAVGGGSVLAALAAFLI